MNSTARAVSVNKKKDDARALAASIEKSILQFLETVPDAMIPFGSEGPHPFSEH